MRYYVRERWTSTAWQELGRGGDLRARRKFQYGSGMVVGMKRGKGEVLTRRPSL